MGCECFSIDDMCHAYTVTGGDYSETSESIKNQRTWHHSFLLWEERAALLLGNHYDIVTSMFDEGISLRATVGAVVPPRVI